MSGARAILLEAPSSVARSMGSFAMTAGVRCEVFPNKKVTRSGPLLWADKARNVFSLFLQCHSLATCLAARLNLNALSKLMRLELLL